MKIQVNGEVIDVQEGETLSGLLKRLGFDCNRAVVEHNRKIVNTPDLPKMILKEKDTLEIVSFVGGG